MSECVCVCGEGVGQGAEGGQSDGRAGRELSLLTAWWKKLSLSLLVFAQRLRSLLPDGSRLKRL